jgi:hypothetical protein
MRAKRVIRFTIGAGSPYESARKECDLDWSKNVASMGLNIEETKAVERFRASVVEPSMTIW